MSNPRIVAAFPGTGKSVLAATVPGVVDSDSSGFSWIYRSPDVRERHPDWPSNYVSHICELCQSSLRLVLVSTHREVRDALVEHEIPFTLVYPDGALREEYRARMARRGSPAALIAKVIDELWESALAECRAQHGCDHLVLGVGEYLLDALLDAFNEPDACD